VSTARPAISYLVCTTPRSGSNLLCEGLASTSMAGNPKEWFNVLEEQRERARWRLKGPMAFSYAAYLEHVLRNATTRNGICGVKLHYYQLTNFAENMGSIEMYQGLPLDELFAAAFPAVRYIWLTRRDKARQAISYHRARQTNEWWRLDDVKPGANGNGVDKVSFDPENIAGLEQYLLDCDAGWQRFFEQSGVEPLALTYEDLAADYTGTIATVLDWLAIPEIGNVSIPPPRCKRQSDSQSEEWLARYLKFKESSQHSDTRFEIGGDSLWPGSSCALPPAWKHWIAHNILSGAPDAVLIDALVENGCSRERAAREVAYASADPYLLAAKQRQQRLDKAESLLAALHKVAGLDPRTETLPRCTGLSRAEFCELYYAANRPVVLQGLMRDWPALTLWTPAYLKREAGDEPVEILTRRFARPHNEANTAWDLKLIRLGDYLDMAQSREIAAECYMAANNGFLRRPGALSLWADFSVFSEYLDPTTADRQSLFWFGPAGTVRPLHHDACNILVCQVAGSQLFKLIPASQAPLLYTDAGFYSEIDCEHPDLDRNPQFRDATVLEVTLQPGEVLFLPIGWSYQVRVLEPSTTISFTNFVFPNSYRW
jgi:LPS sulfotransferase NodH